MKNLIITSVSYNLDYIKLLELLLLTLYKHGNILNKNIDVLILTEDTFINHINNILDKLNITNIKYYCLTTITNVFTSSASRLEIFNYEDINKYDKILYLDTDILISNDISHIFDYDICDNKLYALEEGKIGEEYWTHNFINKTNDSAFSAGVLLFKNTIEIKELFGKIITHIINYFKQGNNVPICLEQPFIVYNSYINKQYNNEQLINDIIVNPTTPTKHSILHFAGGAGHYDSKIDKMRTYYNRFLI